VDINLAMPKGQMHLAIQFRCNAVLELTYTSQAEGTVHKTFLIKTPVVSSMVPRPTIFLTNWLQFGGFPLPPDISYFARTIHKTQESAICMTPILS
jgi:hypothetical protein